MEAPMENIHIDLVDNELNTEDFVRLRVEAGFMKTPLPQAECALKNGLFAVTAIHDGKVIGMGRLVGDGAMYWYLQEIVVSPEYQGLGIGTRIVNRLINHVKESALPGSKVTVGLMAAEGKERFYEKLGFYGRPNDNCGAGMDMRLDIDSNTRLP